MTSTPFMVKLTAEERGTLDAERARMGLRSMADVIRLWIGNASAVHKAAQDTMLFGQGFTKVTHVPPAYRQDSGVVRTQAGPSEIITGEAKPSPRSAGSRAAARPTREGPPQSPPSPTVQLGPSPAAPGSRLKKR